MIVNDLYSSILRFCSNFAAANGCEFVNFDAHADEGTLAPVDYIGISSFSCASHGGLQTVQVLIGIALLNDENLFKTINLIGQIYEQLQPGKRIRVFDADTGNPKGWLTVEDGTRLMPVGGSVSRPLQYIMVSMGTNCYVTP